jgi:hypothetical protein
MRVSIPQSEIISGPADTSSNKSRSAIGLMGEVLLEPQLDQPLLAWMDKKEIENRSPFGKEVITIDVTNEKEEVARFHVSVSINKRGQAVAELYTEKKNKSLRKKIIATWKSLKIFPSYFTPPTKEE